MNLSGDARLLWDAAVGLNRAVRPVSPAPSRTLPPLLFFTDPARTPRPWETAARLPPGAAVVYRHFGQAEAETWAWRLREATRKAGVRLLIGLDAHLAEAVGADGLHLPERALASAASLRAQHPGWLMTAAVHAPGAVGTPAGQDLNLLGLDVLGLDALVLSPVFPAGGASAAKPALGVEAFSMAVRSSLLPIYALGGIKAETVNRLAGSGACGIAAVDAVTAAFA